MWVRQIREDGRRVLRNVEEVARETVRQVGMGEVDECGKEGRAVAREAVAKAERALKAVSR